jgi:diguanylate cyclase (GGDEF)-like protein/PAS domain S-box-containing protein
VRGEFLFLDVHKAPFVNEMGEVIGVVGSGRNVTAQRMDEDRLKQMALVLEHSSEAMLISDAANCIIDVNAAFIRITGFSRKYVMGKNPNVLNSGRQNATFYRDMWESLELSGNWQGEIWNRKKNGQLIAVWLTISTLYANDGTVHRRVALFSDITKKKNEDELILRRAHFDALTNLPNRVLLADSLQQGIVQARRRGQYVAVAYLDLDGFKSINDKYGHEVGDRLLEALSVRMQATLRDGDTLARIGGDEFVAVLVDLPDTATSVPMLTRLLAAAAHSVRVGERLLQVSASVGVTFHPQAEEVEPDQLLRQADQAMYQAKLAGKNRYHIFDLDLDRSLRSQRERLDRIRGALDHDEFVLHYQPKVNLRTGAVVGVEALIRWQHPKQGLLAPAAFLPLIDGLTLEVELGEWVLRAALTQMEIWQASGFRIKVSINLGAMQLQQEDFVDRLLVILAQHPAVEPTDLEFEVLETSALADLAQVSRVIKACGQIGIKFAIDDFGTGYSSLTYLKGLRVAQIKIDQSFVLNMLNDPDDMAILQGVIGLAAAFNLEVIAEGVETVAHGSALLRLNCELAQGYGIARPMPAEQLPVWAVSWQPDAEWRAEQVLIDNQSPMERRHTATRPFAKASSFDARLHSVEFPG